MSHKRSITGSFLDRAAIAQVCQRKDLPCQIALGEELLTVKLFGSQQVKAIAAIRFPGWTYEVAVNQQGGLEFDDYKGAWGDTAHLDQFRADYNAEVVQRAYEQEGFRLESQQVLSNGDLQLVFCE